MSEQDRNNARFLRVAVIRNLLGSGNLDREDALELLDGNLTPSDPFSYLENGKPLVSDLNCQSIEEALEEINEAVNEDGREK